MVLFVSYAGAFGGAERLLVDFAGGLALECAIACPPGALDAAARERGLRTFALRPRPLELRGPRGQPLLALGHLAAHRVEVSRLVAAVDPDLVVAWGMRSLLAAAALTRGRTPLAFQHNDFLPGRAIGALVRGAATRAALVTAPSQAVLDDLGPLPGRVRSEVIAPGVALDRFSSGPAGATPPEVLV